MKTALILFLFGILICTTAPSAANSPIVLSADNTVSITGPVNDMSMAKAQQELGSLSAKLSTGTVIYLVIDSPGGSVVAGNQFIDFANSLPQKISPICLFCASMGYHIFESLGERIVYSSSSLMSHRVAVGGISGQVPGEANSRLQNILRIATEMDEKVSKRIGLPLQTYQSMIVNELWLTGEQAVNMKHADRIAKISCDKNLLSESKKDTVDTIFGPVTVELSKCPLITGILSFDFKKEAFRSRAEALDEVKKVKRSVLWGY